MSNISSALYFKSIVWFSRAHGIVLRLTGGKVSRSLRGLNMLLLTTRGRHTGQRKDTPLLYLEDRGQYYCVASFGGSDRHPDWFLNLEAELSLRPEGKCVLLVSQKHLAASAYVTSGQERNEAWARLVKYYPPFADYQKRTQRIIPVIRFDPISDTNRSS